jgi:hypothetical protein
VTPKLQHDRLVRLSCQTREEDFMTETTEPGRGLRLETTELRLPMWLCELIGSAALLWAFWAYLGQARGLKQPLNPADVGAGGFPMLLASIALAALVLLLGIITVRRLRGTHADTLVVPRPFFVLAAMMLMVAQAMLFDRLGALVTVLGFSVAIIWACGERRPLHVIGVPVLLTAFIYVVFVLALGVKLP